MRRDTSGLRRVAPGTTLARTRVYTELRRSPGSSSRRRCVGAESLRDGRSGRRRPRGTAASSASPAVVELDEVIARWHATPRTVARRRDPHGYVDRARRPSGGSSTPVSSDTTPHGPVVGVGGRPCDRLRRSTTCADVPPRAVHRRALRAPDQQRRAADDGRAAGRGASTTVLGVVSRSRHRAGTARVGSLTAARPARLSISLSSSDGLDGRRSVAASRAIRTRGREQDRCRRPRGRALHGV